MCVKYPLRSLLKGENLDQRKHVTVYVNCPYLSPGLRNFISPLFSPETRTIGRPGTSGPSKGLARSMKLVSGHFHTLPRYRHQLFKVGTDAEGQSVTVKMKYYLEYLDANRYGPQADNLTFTILGQG